MVQERPRNPRRSQVSSAGCWPGSHPARQPETGLFFRYQMQKEGKLCRLIIKECRPDDECEYACGMDERRTRARLFVEGALFSHHISSTFFLSGLLTLC